MECLSDTYNIYLTDDNTLLFYDTLQKGERDKVNIEVKNAPNILIELAGLMAEKTQNEIYKIVCEWQEKNGTIPDIVKAMLHHMLWGVELQGSDTK